MEVQAIGRNWRQWYETTYSTTDGSKYMYRTKSLTPKHQQILDRQDVEKGTTIKFDRDIDWVFGLYSEIISKKRLQKV